MCQKLIGKWLGTDKKSTAAAVLPAQQVSNTGTVKKANVKKSTASSEQDLSTASDNIGAVVETSENLGDVNLGSQKKRKKVVGIDL